MVVKVSDLGWLPGGNHFTRVSPVYLEEATHFSKEGQVDGSTHAGWWTWPDSSQLWVTPEPILSIILLTKKMEKSHLNGNIIFYRALFHSFLHLKKALHQSIFFCYLNLPYFLPLCFHGTLSTGLLYHLTSWYSFLLFSSFLSFSSLLPPSPSLFLLFFLYVHDYFPYNVIHFLHTQGQEHSNKWLYFLTGWMNKWMNGQNKQPWLYC